MLSLLLVHFTECPVNCHCKQRDIVVEEFVLNIDIILEFACHTYLSADMSDFLVGKDDIEFSSVLADEIIAHRLAFSHKSRIEEERFAFDGKECYIIEDYGK